MDNPVLTLTDKRKLIVTAAGSKVSSSFDRFLDLVLQNNRENHLQEIALKYIDLYRRKNNIYYGKLTTATVVNAATEAKLMKMIESTTGTRLHHGIKHVVVQTDLLQIEREEAAVSSFLVWLISPALVAGLAIALSRQFLAPFKEEIERLDNFVKASAHELNTPITSLLLGLDSIKNELKESKKSGISKSLRKDD
jgi:signal transduction histidine kinase